MPTCAAGGGWGVPNNNWMIRHPVGSRFVGEWMAHLWQGHQLHGLEPKLTLLSSCCAEQCFRAPYTQLHDCPNLLVFRSFYLVWVMVWVHGRCDRLSQHNTLYGSFVFFLWFYLGATWSWNGEVCFALYYGWELKSIGWCGVICSSSKARMSLFSCGWRAYCSWLQTHGFLSWSFDTIDSRESSYVLPQIQPMLEKPSNSSPLAFLHAKS